MQNKEFSVVIIGQITLDDAVLMDAPTKRDCPGGDGIYALSGAYLWQKGKFGLVIRRGDDFDMSQIRDVVGDAVDFEGVVEVPGVPNIHIWNMYDRMGNRYFINQRWSGRDEDMAPRPADIPRRYITDSKAIHIAAMPIFWEKELIRAMPDSGTTDLIVQVDPHFDGVYPEYHDLWWELFRKITIFQPSEVELTRLFSVKPFDDVRDYLPYLKQITQLGPRICNVKLGSRGCLVYDSLRDEAYHVPACKSQVVDVTGCGDTFCGAFLTSFVEEEDIFIAAVKGSVAAAFNIEHYGGMENFSIPYEKVLARYQDFMRSIDRERCRII